MISIDEYLEAVGEYVVERSDLNFDYDNCGEESIFLIAESDILVCLLYNGLFSDGFSITMEAPMSRITRYPWLVSETTSVAEGARQVLEYYDLYVKKVRLEYLETREMF